MYIKLSNTYNTIGLKFSNIEKLDIFREARYTSIEYNIRMLFINAYVYSNI